MPLNIRDYTADTMGLTLAQHGAYLLSIMKYWQKGEALTAPELRAICGREIDRVAQFYTMVAGRWHHKRIDADLKNIIEKERKARVKAMLGVEARRKAGLLPKK